MGGGGLSPSSGIKISHLNFFSSMTVGPGRIETGDQYLHVHVYSEASAPLQKIFTLFPPMGLILCDEGNIKKYAKIMIFVSIVSTKLKRRYH